MRNLFDRGVCSAGELRQRYLVREIVEYERYCRDYGLWDEMGHLFADDAAVRISWYNGSGREFVEASKKMQGAYHKLHNTIVRVAGKRAAAESIAQIHSRQCVAGRQRDLISFVRLLYRLRETDAGWQICGIDCIYERDLLIPALEEAERSKLACFRPSYCCLGYVLNSLGAPVNNELPGEDRPELVDALYGQCGDWLRETDY